MIQGTYYKEWSTVLGREMEFKVYGHAGVPVLALPARGGRFYDWVRSMPMHFLPIGKMLFMASRCSKGKVSARQVFFCTVDMICLMRLSNSALVSALVCIIRQVLNSFWFRFISSSNNSSAFLMFSLNS